MQYPGFKKNICKLNRMPVNLINNLKEYFVLQGLLRAYVLFNLNICILLNLKANSMKKITLALSLLAGCVLGATSAPAQTINNAKEPKLPQKSTGVPGGL